MFISLLFVLFFFIFVYLDLCLINIIPIYWFWILSHKVKSWLLRLIFKFQWITWFVHETKGIICLRNRGIISQLLLLLVLNDIAVTNLRLFPPIIIFSIQMRWRWYETKTALSSLWFIIIWHYNFLFLIFSFGF